MLPAWMLTLMLMPTLRQQTGRHRRAADASSELPAMSKLPASGASLGSLALLLMMMLMLSACSTLSPVSTSPSSSSSTSSSTAPAAKATAARDPVLDALLARQDRVYRIAAPLITKNAVLCRSLARPLLGFTAKNLHSYPPELAAAVRNTLGLGERLQVMQVLEGSGALRAGMARGDLLQSIQDIPVPEGPQAENEAARTLAPVLKNLTEIRVTVLRRGQPLSLQVPLTLACAVAIDIGNAPNLNAYSDGRRVMLTRGLLDNLTSDEDVAAVIAREIAHNVLQHARQLQQVATLSAVIESLLPLKPEPASYTGSGGIKPTPEKMDQEADRLAMFMLARSGYDPLSLIRVSQKLATLAPPSQTNSYSALHPWTEERHTIAQASAKDIRQKQAAKKPLVP